MAKSHYSFKKRKKELERKLKQEKKRQRKFSNDPIAPDESSDSPQDEVENSQTDGSG
jgi:hypothetical protein